MTNDAAPENKPLRYRDLRLRLDDYQPATGALMVWVDGEAPGGAMRRADAVPRTYDRQAFYDDVDLYQGGLLGRVDFAELGKDDLYTLGKLLADLALPEGVVRQLFDKSLVAATSQGLGLRLRLIIEEPELAQLPWEYMCLPQASGEPRPSDFLALRREVSIVRTDTVESAPRPLPDRRPRIVGVLSRPIDQEKLDVTQDRAALDTAVQAANKAAGEELVSVTWVEKPATRAALEAALQDGADVFQFSGHASFDLGDEGHLLLESANRRGDRYAAGDAAQLLRNAGVRLVVLSACEAGRRNGQVMWSGVAPALTREQVPAVIGNQFDILDSSAILLADRIYPRLFLGYTIDEALFWARQAIYQQGSAEPESNRDWGVPVLYLRDADGVLFPLPEKAAEQAEAQAPFLRVARVLDRVAGEAIEAEIDSFTRGHVEIETHIGVVEKGAKAIGVKIGKLGG